MRQYISTIKPRGRNALPCLQGWLSNINAVTLLFNDLGYDLLLTNRLNQDCIENLFSQIRYRGGNADNPDTRMFRAHLRDVMIDAILRPNSNGNCELDVDSFVLGLNTLTGAPSGDHHLIHESAQQPHAGAVMVDVGSAHDYSQFTALSLPSELQLESTLTYIGGFIMLKLKSKVCESCYMRLTDSSCSSKPHQQLITLKKYDENSHLVIPSQSVVDILKRAEAHFAATSEQHFHGNKLKASIITSLKGICNIDEGSCCNNKMLILSSYITVRPIQ